MKTNFLIFIALFAVSAHAYCNSYVPSRTRYLNLSMQSETGSLHCLIDEKPIDATLSSDGEAVIVSGTAYVPVAELSHCKADVPIHVRRAAPHVGFLSDINIKAGIYASMVPVSASPVCFLAVVAKIGSDRNLVKKPGFYRTAVSKSTLEEEGSSDMNPVISLDGKYISVDRRQCGSDSKIDVIEIKTGRSIAIDNEACSKLFNWVSK